MLKKPAGFDPHLYQINRDEYSYYVTDPRLVRSVMNSLFEHYGEQLKLARNALDPAAGGCEWFPSVYPSVVSEFGFSVDTLDIRADSRAAIIGDYLTHSVVDKYDLVITNPPFFNIVPFIQKMVADTRQGGFTLFLCHANFVSTKAGRALMNTLPIRHVWQHQLRPKMDVTAKSTDPRVYFHIGIQPGYEGDAGFSVID